MKRCMQLIVGVSIIGLAMVSLSYSANVTISGMVTDSTGAAIAGAEVKLLVGGQNTTTGSDGSFHLLVRPFWHFPENQTACVISICSIPYKRIIINKFVSINKFIYK